MWLYPEVRTLGDFIGYHARHTPGRRALVCGTRTVSFAEYDTVANRIAQGLLAHGVVPGERVGFVGLNSTDFYFALIGTVRTRAAFVPFNWRLSVPELALLLADSETRLVFVERTLASLWDAALAQAGTPVTTIWFDADDTLESQFAHRPVAAPDITGDLFLNPLPNFHLLAIGIAFQCLYNGVAVSILRQFDPAAVCDAIGRDRPTLLTLTPTMIQMLLDHPAAQDTDFTSIRLMLYAGSAISLGLIKRAIARMPGKFMQFYGATEAGGAFSILRPDEHDLDDETSLQSCGRPLPLITFRIVDAAGNDVPDGEPGELVVRTPAITAGYWKQPDATARALQHGWYHTGDVARRDARGLYTIVDRVKDMIVSGGENVYSAEVEGALSTHPDVAAVAVIGVPDARWGEAVRACVIRRSGSILTEAELLTFARERLAGYKVPKSVAFMDAFPLVPSGKVSKKDLRAPYWVEHSRRVG
eukprot:gene10189-10258_t